MEKTHKPFAITAKTLGIPRKLYTPLLLVNAEHKKGTLTAAYVNAMWDTGSEFCLMSRKLADRLGFKFDRDIKSIGLTGETIAHYGRAHVALVNNGEMIKVWAAIIDDDLHDEYSFIIGMNLISMGTLAITTLALQTTLSFKIPSSGNIDFVEEAQGTDATAKYLPLSSTTEDERIYQGPEVLELILPDSMKNE